jgi:uncharacterized protein YdbL (DUF1318 family)
LFLSLSQEDDIMKHATTLSALLMPLWLTACVTINVYFPAAAAQQAADRIVQEVYGKKPGAEQNKPPEATPGTEPRSDAGHPLTLARAFIATLEAVVPPAHAAANLNVSTPAIRSLTASMAKRQGALQPYYASGAVGMTRDGLITVRNPGAVPLRERNQVKQLVADENRDRNALYGEIAKANGHPEWESEIRATFARSWVNNASGGWWYQDGKGNWVQKK